MSEHDEQDLDFEGTLRALHALVGSNVTATIGEQSGEEITGAAAILYGPLHGAPAGAHEEALHLFVGASADSFAILTVPRAGFQWGAKFGADGVAFRIGSIVTRVAPLPPELM